MNLIQRYKQADRQTDARERKIMCVGWLSVIDYIGARAGIQHSTGPHNVAA